MKLYLNGDSGAERVNGKEREKETLKCLSLFFFFFNTVIVINIILFSSKDNLCVRRTNRHTRTRAHENGKTAMFGGEWHSTIQQALNVFTKFSQSVVVLVVFFGS